MKPRTIELKIQALDNAAEFIRSHPECGWTDEEMLEVGLNDKDFKTYQNQCNQVHDMLTKQADKLRIKLKGVNTNG